MLQLAWRGVAGQWEYKVGSVKGGTDDENDEMTRRCDDEMMEALDGET